jgi:DNA polymerase I
MEFDLCPSVTLQTGTFNAVVAPVDMFTASLNANKELQRFMFLYVSGNFSRVMTGINRTAGTFEVRRAFTAHQLLTILREAHHTIILIEHDPSLFEGTEREVMGEVLRALRSAAQDAMVILYAPAADSIFHTLAKRGGPGLLPCPATGIRTTDETGRRNARTPEADDTGDIQWDEQLKAAAWGSRPSRTDGNGPHGPCGMMTRSMANSS